jgi:hypothetical protein
VTESDAGDADENLVVARIVEIDRFDREPAIDCTRNRRNCLHFPSPVSGACHL